MATITRARPQSPPRSRLAAPEVYRINVDEYERMADVLEDQRIELIDGYLVKKLAKDPPHVWTVATVLKVFQAMVPRWLCRKEDPVRIPNFDEPEPDISVVRGTLDDYLNGAPVPRDVALLVEVSDTTLDRDRGEKKDAYARARIPVYWIINLVDRQVEVYSNPGRGRYRTSQVYPPGENLPVIIGGSQVGQIAVNDILPPRR